MVSPNFLDQLAGTLLEQIDDSVVQGVLVLLEPSRQIVGDSSGVVDDGEVGLNLTGLGGLGLDEAVGLAQVLALELVFKGLVSGFGEHRLFLQDGQDTHGLILEHEIVQVSVT